MPPRQPSRSGAAARLAPPRIEPLRLQNLVAADENTVLRPDDGVEGLSFTGLDLSGMVLPGISFSECEFAGLQAHDADLRGARLLDCIVRRLDAPVLRSARSEWREVEIESGRIGSAELYDSSWSSVRFTDCKLGFINLGGSTLRDVLFENCTIDELDLGQATITRMAFVSTAVGSLDLQRATLRDVDLRGAELGQITGIDNLAGATVSSYQLSQLAPLWAQAIGLRVED